MSFCSRSQDAALPDQNAAPDESVYRHTARLQWHRPSLQSLHPDLQQLTAGLGQLHRLQRSVHTCSLSSGKGTESGMLGRVEVKGGQKCIKLFFKLTVKNMDTEVHDLPFQSILPDFFLQTFTGSTLTLWCTCYDK